MPDITANGVRLHYEVRGEGPTVLLLHPVGLDLTCWEAQTEFLRTEYRVVALDLRGHGRSEVAPPPYSLSTFAADSHELLLSLNATPAHVMGLSLGGMVAQVLALDYPTDVLSLILADTVCNLTPDGRAAMVARGEAAERGGMESVVQATLDRWFTPGFIGSEVVARCRRRLLADSVTTWDAAWRAISEVNTESRLHEIRVPALVMTGELDVSSPVERGRAIADAIPGARFLIVPGAPHIAPMELPDLFNPLVLEFLRMVPGQHH
jgi:3-oxoadipate enol-lactonase